VCCDFHGACRYCSEYWDYADVDGMVNSNYVTA
jgi:hypothetical protein